MKIRGKMNRNNLPLRTKKRIIMYRIKNAFFIGLTSLLLLTWSCSDSFLEQSPQGQLADDQINNVKGVEWLLIGAYGLMNGNTTGTWGNYSSAPSMWLFGEVAGGHAHKGSEPADQATMLDIERHRAIPPNEHLANMWNNYYEGITRCNTTLRALYRLQEGDGEKFSDQRAREIEAEAKMLRGHYYFFLWRVFKNIPYVDETLSTEEAAAVPNTEDVLPHIEADFKFAVDNLPAQSPMGEVGRMNQIGAKAYLGKLYLYQGKKSEALALFKEVIASRPDLKEIPYLDNFNVNTENGPSSILAAQHIIDPDGSGENANVGDMLSGLYGSAPVNCCGFYQPSFDLVNAFRVTDEGLPMLDYSYRNDPYLSDFGLSGNAKDNYQVDTDLAVDPRLDYTVGRRGVPYHDWGIFPGDAWIRDAASAGPFVAYKAMIDLEDFPGNVQNGAPYVTALNVNIIRLSDVYLMAAEAALDSDLQYALDRVNDVRIRASKIPHKEINGRPAAAYKVEPYPSFPDKEYAMKAIQFERRLELALEGHRFFDLVRWGIAKQELESYSQFEGQFLDLNKGINFEEKNTYFPIPQAQIDRSGGSLVQNPGY